METIKCSRCGEAGNTVPFSMAGQHHMHGPLGHAFSAIVGPKGRHGSRFYLGIRYNPDVRIVFKSATVPNGTTHGGLFVACIGPFKTKRGAEFMRDNPGPCVVTVLDAETLAKGKRVA